MSSKFYENRPDIYFITYDIHNMCKFFQVDLESHLISFSFQMEKNGSSKK